jgi:hypothetical protein
MSCIRIGQTVRLVNVSNMPDDWFLLGDDEYSPNYRELIQRYEHERVQFEVTFIKRQAVEITRGDDVYCFGVDHVAVC